MEQSQILSLKLYNIEAVASGHWSIAALVVIVLVYFLTKKTPS